MILLSLSSSNHVLADNKNSPEIKTSLKEKGEYVRKRFLALMNKPFENLTETPAQQKILIIGDSHAQDFLNSIIENNFINKSQIRTRYIPTRCQIFLGKNQDRKWLATDRQLCEKSDNLELAKAQINDADVIIFAAFWRKWAAEHFAKTINNLKLKKDQRVFVIGRRSFRKVSKEQSKNLNTEQRRKYLNPVDQNQIEINNILRNTLDEKVFVDVHRLICGEGSNCPAFTPDSLKLISFDGGHLSQEGAKYMGNILFKKSQLKELFQTQ